MEETILLKYLKI